MSAALKTWPCGHERTPANSAGGSYGTARCRECLRLSAKKSAATARAAGPWGGEGVIDRLKVLDAEGKSRSEIAALLGKEFGIKVSRNAVIGILSRLGDKRPTSAPKPKIGAQPGANKHSGKNAIATAKAKVLIAGGAVYEADESLKPLPLPKGPELKPQVADLTLLKSHQCKWPIGNGPFAFCGRFRPGDGPYCAHHQHLSVSHPVGRKPYTASQLMRSPRRHLG